MLNSEELDYSESITHPFRREEFLSTRLLARRLAAELGYDPFRFRIIKDERGKPYGESEQERIHLSIAHSKEYVLCGISPGKDLGIDMEPAGREVSEALGNRILHPSEEQALDLNLNGYGEGEDTSTGAEEGMTLVRLWTLKEALVKLEGSGLRTNLNELRTVRHSEVEFEGIFNNDKRAKICSFQHQDYWIAVAYYQ